MNPFFSIVIPLFNKEQEITKTITSVLSQTCSDFEIIVINDGSTDRSLKVIEEISDKRIHIYTTNNKGVSHARNLGIKKSTSKHIAFLDADDLWKPHHLEDLKNIINSYPDCGLYCKSYEKQYYKDVLIKARFNKVDENFEGVIQDFFISSLLDCIAWTSAVAMPKAMFNTYGYFDETLKSGQDTDMWIKIALKERVVFSSVISATRQFSSTGNHLSMSSHVKQRIKIIERYQHLEKDNNSLKVYLDINRYYMAIERKSKGDLNAYHFLVDGMDKNALNIRQKLILNSPIFLINKLKKLQKWLIKNKIYLSANR